MGRPRKIMSPGDMGVAVVEQEDTGFPVNMPDPVENTGGLPDAKDIDPTKIERKILTKQGWVVPVPVEFYRG